MKAHHGDTEDTEMFTEDTSEKKQTTSVVSSAPSVSPW